MYLREMGSVELLSREGEIAIAKRIEAGRNTMIAGLCESPLTFQAITIWRDELLSEDILLRDVIDLEATFGRSLDGEGELDEPGLDGMDMSAAPRQTASDEPDLDADGNPIVTAEDDDDDDEASAMSLAAMEAALKPRVLETLDVIARDYIRLAEMQDLRMTATLNDAGRFSTDDEAAYQKLRSEIVLLVNELHLHNNRIEALIDAAPGLRILATSRQRLGLAVLAVLALAVEVTLAAVEALVVRRVRVALGGDDAAALGRDHDAAAGSAEAAHRLVPLPVLFHLGGGGLRQLGNRQADGGGGAGGDAALEEFATGYMHGSLLQSCSWAGTRMPSRPSSPSGMA
jgi:hypothetical protein